MEQVAAGRQGPFFLRRAQTDGIVGLNTGQEEGCMTVNSPQRPRTVGDEILQLRQHVGALAMAAGPFNGELDTFGPAPASSSLLPLPGNLQHGEPVCDLPRRGISAPLPTTKTVSGEMSRRASVNGASNSRKSLDDSCRRSVRYGEAKTHLHYQRDTLRQYRKTKRDWHCGKCCSRRSASGDWVDSPQAKAVAYAGIFLNTFFFFFQTYFEDHHTTQESQQVDQAVYVGVEMVFICFFSLELLLRVRVQNVQFNKWNQYDGFFLLMIFVDACILNFIPTAQPVHRVVVRLMPTFQVFRLGRFVPEFRMIIKGIFSAMRAVLWSLCLLALVIYFFAVLSSTCIGRAQRFEDDPSARQLFGTMPKSMLTLFTFATLEEFPDTVRHFMDTGEVWGGIIAVAIVIFILFTNLSLLNLVTAVVVDTIIDILPKKRAEKLAQERAEMVQRLEAIFTKMDQDGNRKLSLEEFRRGLDSLTEVQNELSLLQIAALDVRELFALIDLNEVGSVAVDEFIDGLLRMVPAPASKKELLGMEYDMHKMWNMLGSGQEQIVHGLNELQEGIMSSLAESVQESHDSLEQCVRDCCAEIEKQLQEQLDAFSAQLLSGQKQILEVARVANDSDRFAVLHRSLEALPSTIAEERRRALDEKQRSLVETLEAKWPAPPAVQTAETPDVVRLQRLVEELKEGQQQLLAAAEHHRMQAAEQELPGPAPPRRFASPTGTPNNQGCHRTRPTPTPLEGVCHPSTDAGPEPEPHSVLQTPAACGHYDPASVRGVPPALDPMPEVLPSQNSSREGEPRVRFPVRSAPPPPTSLTQLHPPPQFMHQQPRLQASVEPATGCAPATPAGRVPGTAQELQPQEFQQVLQATARTMPAVALAAGSLPSSHSHSQGRIALVQQWVRRHGWAGMPFDKLVLHLDRLGVELSEAEQDALQWCLRNPMSAGTM